MSGQGSAPLALVTGASSGIGRELARTFAENGFDLVVVGRSERIDEVASELGAAGRDVVAVRADLTRGQDVERVWKAVVDLERPLAAAALNAGTSVGGALDQTSIDDHLALVDLNVRSTVHLAKRVVDHMVANGEGRILITSSIAAATPTPYQAAYAASKTFLQSFSQAIRHELADTGVTVTSLMPGPTETRIFERADMGDSRIGQEDKDDPADVARDGFEALMAGKASVKAGSFLNNVMVQAAVHLPERVGSVVAAWESKRKRDE